MNRTFYNIFKQAQSTKDSFRGDMGAVAAMLDRIDHGVEAISSRYSVVGDIDDEEEMEVD